MTSKQLKKMKRNAKTAEITRIDPFTDSEALTPWHEAAHMLTGTLLLKKEYVFDYLDDGCPAVVPKDGSKTACIKGEEVMDYITHYLAGYAAEAYITHTGVNYFVDRLLETCERASMIGLQSKCDDFLAYELCKRMLLSYNEIKSVWACAFKYVISLIEKNKKKFDDLTVEAKKFFA